MSHCQNISAATFHTRRSSVYQQMHRLKLAPSNKTAVHVEERNFNFSAG